MFTAFLKGILLAFGLVVPLGIQNTFVFNQAANQKLYLRVVPLVITSIIADMILIISAIAGVEVLLSINWLQPVITLLGFVFLLVMGTVLLRKQETDLQDDTRQLTIFQQITFTLAFAILNPHALLDTFIVIGSVSSSFIGPEKHAFAIGCIFIDALWFTALSLCGYHIKKLSSGPRLIYFLNKASGVLMYYIALDLLKDYLTKGN